MSKNRSYVHDSYTRRAFREGYQARSVFKLKEIDRRHGLLGPGMRVLELGAAPGSWSRYVLQRIFQPGNSRAWLCAVDLEKLEAGLRHSPALSFFQADFGSPELQQSISLHLESGGLFDVVLSDMAPRTTGRRTVDTSRSLALVEQVVSALPRFLKAEGTLLFKLFQGGDEKYLQQELRSIFASCQSLKPQAVRRQSFEVYMLCKSYQNNHRPGIR